jgi:hypothetical protein
MALSHTLSSTRQAEESMTDCPDADGNLHRGRDPGNADIELVDEEDL